MKLIYPVLAAFGLYLYFGYKFCMFLCSERVIEAMNDFENQIMN